MSTLQQLKVFVNERLTAAAKEILGAVERTIIEYQNEMDLTKQDVKQSRLPLDVFNREEMEVLRTVSQEVTLSQVEAPTKQRHGEESNPVMNQDTPSPPLQEPQERWSSQEEGKLQDLVEGDAVASIYNPCSNYDRSCQTRTVRDREGDLLPSSPAEWMKTEEEGRGYGTPEATGAWQPLSSDCGDENEDSVDAEWAESRAHSGFKMLKSKKRTKQRQKRTGVGAKRRESVQLLSLKSLWPSHGPFCCKVCGESFRRRSYLMKHVQSHADNTAVLCPQNQAALTENGIQRLKTHEEDNLCDVCGKTFTHKPHLKRHMLVHTGQKPHCCKECGKRFTRSESLRIHMRIHMVEKPYTCDACGKRFSQKGNMTCHMRTHTGEKPHRCGICCRAFAHKKDMSRHMKVHTGKR